MILVVTGTSTDVGKTVATAALVARARSRTGPGIAVVKPAQTGAAADEPADLAQVQRLAGPVGAIECVRYPGPLGRRRRAGALPLERGEVAAAVAAAAAANDVTIVEAGGVLVRLADTGGDAGGDPGHHRRRRRHRRRHLLPVARHLNHTEAPAVRAIRARGLGQQELIVGSLQPAPISLPRATSRTCRA